MAEEFRSDDGSTWKVKLPVERNERLQTAHNAAAWVEFLPGANSRLWGSLE
jgi:hypothetical protein